MSQRLELVSSSAKVLRFRLDFMLPVLANLADSEIKRFRRLYNKPPAQYQRYSDEDLLRFRDELRVLWEYDAGRIKDLGGGFKVRSFDGGPRAKQLSGVLTTMFKNMRGEPEPVPKIVCDYWLRSEKQPVEVVWKEKTKKVRARPQCLPAILAFGCVRYADHMKFCANPECKRPYFITTRRDQKYCSDECAAPAKREAKRRWWAEHRGKLGKQQHNLGRA